MAGKNGYGTLEQLRAIKRLQKDYRAWPVMVLRLQALTQAEIDEVIRFAKDPTTGEDRLGMNRDAQIAFALVEPDIASIAATDLEAAVAEVQTIPMGVRAQLSQMILYELTYCQPKDAFQSFFDAAGSRESEAPGVSTTSN